MAVAIDRFGGLDQLAVHDLPKPQPAADEVLIRVQAAGVGIWDSLQRQGEFSPDVPEFPLVLGAECSGVIERVGAGVTTLHEGDAVYAYFSGKQGAYAQYVAVKAGAVAVKPASLSFIEAAAVPVDAITAHQAIVDELKLKPDEWLFVAGAAGGVGNIAVQIAVLIGARVIATARSANFSFLESLGLERAHLIDYTQSDVVKAVHDITGGSGADAALDAAGHNGEQTLATVRDGGRMADLTDQTLPEDRGVTVLHIESKPSAARLKTLGELFEAGQLRVHVDRVFELAQARAAQAAVETHHGPGKIVLSVA